MDLYVLPSTLFHLQLKLMSIKTVCCRPKTFPDPYFYLRANYNIQNFLLIFETFERRETVNFINQSNLNAKITGAYCQIKLRKFYEMFSFQNTRATDIACVYKL